MNSTDIIEILLSLPPLLLALTFHEFFHGFIALKMGDPTARNAGRLTLNPIKHIDPIGLIALILFHFGWAKPVPFNPVNFRNYRRGILLTAIAGPLSNLMLAVPFGLLLRVFPVRPATQMLNTLWIMVLFGLIYNLILCAFNLIPIPPLDGSKVLTSFLPDRYATVTLWLERYGFIMLIGLILLEQLTGIPIFWGWINPFINFFAKLLVGVWPLI
jgi:Zn-dependent protease